VNLSTVRTALREALSTIDGLSVSSVRVSSIAPPHAVIVIGPIEYDATMGRGSDIGQAQIIVYVSRADDGVGIQQLDAFRTGTGERSIKAAIEAAAGDGISYFRVRRSEEGTASLGDQEFIAATFDVEVNVTGLS